MIEVRQLWKSYGDPEQHSEDLDESRPAVADLSFQVQPGEIFGLLGPNGAGKTTTLRILATMLEPTRGTIRVCGHDVRFNPAEVRRHIGFVSSNTAIYERMTASETVEFFGRLYGMPRKKLRDRKEKLFEQLQMESFQDVLGGKLSTGMKQKVSIARALVHDPPVLVFDEPTIGLDVFAARALLEIIGSLRESGKCVLFSTHIMREVEKLCDRVAILHEGRMLAEGTVESLCDETECDVFEDVFFNLIDQHDGTLQPALNVPEEMGSESDLSINPRTPK